MYVFKGSKGGAPAWIVAKFKDEYIISALIEDSLYGVRTYSEAKFVLEELSKVRPDWHFDMIRVFPT